MPAEAGLFRLRDDLAPPRRGRSPPGLPARALRPLRSRSRTSTRRKSGPEDASPVYVPSSTRRSASPRARQIGNITADGRPILGLDSRHLLEITLDSGEGSYLDTRAHLDSLVLGAGPKAGFDSVERVLRRSAPPHLRGRDRPLLRPADELAGLRAGPVRGWSPTRTRTRPRSSGREADVLRQRAVLRRRLGAPCETGTGALPRHDGVLPGRGEVPLRRPPRMRRASLPREARERAGAAPRAASRHAGRASPGRGAGGPAGRRAAGRGRAPYRYLVPMDEMLGAVLRRGRHSRGWSGVHAPARPRSAPNWTCCATRRSKTWTAPAGPARRGRPPCPRGRAEHRRRLRRRVRRHPACSSDDERRAFAAQTFALAPAPAPRPLPGPGRGRERGRGRGRTRWRPAWSASVDPARRRSKRRPNSRARARVGVRVRERPRTPPPASLP